MLHLLRRLKLNSSSLYTKQQLYTQLGVKKKADQKKVQTALKQLIKEGAMEHMPKNRYRWITMPPTVVGQLDHVRPFYAYLVVAGLKQDVFIAGKNLGTAVDKDWVKVALKSPKPSSCGKGKRLEGVVMDVIERNPLPMIGLVASTGQETTVVVETRRIAYTVFLDQETLPDLAVDDKVAIRLHPFQPGTTQLMGYLVKRFGQAGLHEVEMDAMLAEFGLATDFPPEVCQEALALPTTILQATIDQRKDLRHLPTFTIDPADSQDFDDALSYQKLENGFHQVGIHIADVSHYVLPHTPLDQEAYQRNTSVYLIDRCIPMLPERLSNQLCSLRPGEDKLTFSALFQLDDAAKIHNQWFGTTVIRSKKCFSYQDAQKVLDGGKGDLHEPLVALHRLAQQLRTKRLQAGAMNFATREWLFELDEQGKPLQLLPKAHYATHQLVEEWMLLTNRAVASQVAEWGKKQHAGAFPFIYRSHDAPDPEKLADFFAFVKGLGYKIQVGKAPVFHAMQQLSEAIRGKPEEDMIQTMAIRSMAKARYTTEREPHFALAFAHYSHFTSPIRRYPDLLVHRLFKQYLQKESVDRSTDYAQHCTHALTQEQKAMAVERACIKYKQVEFMQHCPPQVWEGMVRGITETNLYIELLTNGCQGVLPISALKEDEYIFEAQKFQLTGKRRGACYRLGDILSVKVNRCDRNKRLMTLIPA